MDEDKRMQPLTDMQALELEDAIERAGESRGLRFTDDEWQDIGLPRTEVNTALLLLGYHKRWAALREENRRLRMFIMETRRQKEQSND